MSQEAQAWKAKADLARKAATQLRSEIAEKRRGINDLYRSIDILEIQADVLDEHGARLDRLASEAESEPRRSA